MNVFLILLTVLSVSFNHLSFKDGLITSSITDMYFDEKGMVWIATGKGLESYDGNRFVQHSTRSTSVMRLAGDGNGTLYVACRGELYSIDLRDRSHTTISQDDSRAIAYYDGVLYVGVGNILKKYTKGSALPEVAAVLGDNDMITALTISDEGLVWLGTDKGDVVNVRLANGSSVRWKLGSKVENVYLDSRGQLWASTFANGLARIDSTGAVESFRHSETDSNTISSDFVRTACEDEDGNLWIGTFSGLDRLDIADGSFRHFAPDKSRPESLSNSSVWVIKRDVQGTLWIGTFFGGINYYNPRYSYYNRIPDSATEGTGLNSSIVRKVGTDSRGNLLVATEGGGFNIVNPETFRSVWYTKTSRQSISENNVKDFLYDKSRNCVWVGTHLGGLDRIDLRNGMASPFRPYGKPGDNPDTDDVLSIEDGGDSLYVGTTKGLFIYSKTTANYRKISGHPDISIIRMDRNGFVWFASGSLFRYDPSSGETECFMAKGFVKSICFLSDGRMAIGDALSCGITVFDPENRNSSFVDLSAWWPEYEHVNHIIQSPLSGKLMVSSSKGFTMLNADGSEAVYFSPNNGFPLDNTNDYALAETEDGTVYVGGLSGMISFNEKDMVMARRPYTLAFSNLYIDGKSVEYLPYKKSLTIPSSASSFAVEFMSSNRIPENVSSFEYKMDGQSKKWTELWNGNVISFTNLPAGHYTLRVRPKNTGETVCAEISMPVRVLPPWYQSLAAQFFYLIAFLGLGYFALRKLVEFLRSREVERIAKIRQNDREKFRTFEKATSIVYSNIDNSEFSVNDLAAEMALSRSTLFEKMKAATGKTPNDFILDIRLKEGLKLLKNNPELNISDISFRVGFSSLHYFSKCFKQRYGETPKDFRNSHK